MSCVNREQLRKDLLLYAVTDRSWLGNETLYEQVEKALKGGATFIQLREKELMRNISWKKRWLSKNCVISIMFHLLSMIMSESQKIWMRMEVHVGQSDMEADDVRKILGEDKILGVSAQTVEQAVLAEKMGADYLGVGAVFSTSTKKDAADVSKETLKAICEAVNIPVIAIGGIGADNILSLQGSGICGIAVVSAIFAAKDIEAATKVLKDRTEKMLK
ncbi:thiamine phosphate synthase [Anaerobutyricum hallii]|uniref:Thiamine-phosphate synthase n=1 Tax=Anaerobutyricum hallii DSM 3353 TaxID=411469 RepID=C0EZ08_9FIRM|nr:thiamine phosphate synthase [Anaerobutyricum hallii]EEG35493.1 thiamine-phosphate diphosphorylase [Anaerobutyricum hallii DSM 3353]